MMDCVVRVIQGPDKGQELRPAAGPNVVGRGARAQLRLTQEDVSYEHALITREGDDFFVENLSAVGTWVGDARVAGKTRLRVGDQIRLSPECVLRLEPAAGAPSSSLRLLLALLLLMVIGGGVAVAFYGNEGPTYVSTTDDWSGAHDALSRWARGPGSRRVSPEAVQLLGQAWRVDSAGNFVESRKLWLRLQILLSGEEPTLRAMTQLSKDDAATATSGRNRDASLQALLTPTVPPKNLNDDEMAAALMQFTRRRLQFATAKSPSGGMMGG
jgi:hypothetical protein